jgi:hypothetical protein
MYYPIENVPSAIRPLVGLLPGSLAAEICVAAASGGESTGAPFLILVVWALAALAAGYALLPWREPA